MATWQTSSVLPAALARVAEETWRDPTLTNARARETTVCFPASPMPNAPSASRRPPHIEPNKKRFRWTQQCGHTACFPKAVLDVLEPGLEMGHIVAKCSRGFMPRQTSAWHSSVDAAFEAANAGQGRCTVLKAGSSLVRDRHQPAALLPCPPSGCARNAGAAPAQRAAVRTDSHAARCFCNV